ncbi:hypothetical protein TWF718_005313 [Orbilia javanica]|uniref:Uncharacterized protein n=1 Tax=Orbilia javanica TaxID=47235 RepID=A0AAN8RE55_9PEZI
MSSGIIPNYPTEVWKGFQVVVKAGLATLHEERKCSFGFVYALEENGQAARKQAIVVFYKETFDQNLIRLDFSWQAQYHPAILISDAIPDFIKGIDGRQKISLKCASEVSPNTFKQRDAMSNELTSYQNATAVGWSKSGNPFFLVPASAAPLLQDGRIKSTLTFELAITGVEKTRHGDFIRDMIHASKAIRSRIPRGLFPALWIAKLDYQESIYKGRFLFEGLGLPKVLAEVDLAYAESFTKDRELKLEINVLHPARIPLSKDSKLHCITIIIIHPKRISLQGASLADHNQDEKGKDKECLVLGWEDFFFQTLAKKEWQFLGIPALEGGKGTLCTLYERHLGANDLVNLEKALRTAAVRIPHPANQFRLKNDEDRPQSGHIQLKSLLKQKIKPSRSRHNSDMASDGRFQNPLGQRPAKVYRSWSPDPSETGDADSGDDTGPTETTKPDEIKVGEYDPNDVQEGAKTPNAPTKGVHKGRVPTSHYVPNINPSDAVSPE